MARCFGQRQEQHVEEDEGDAGEKVLHRVDAPLRHELQAEHGHEGERQELDAVFHRPAYQAVEIDRRDHPHAKGVGLEPLEALLGEAPGLGHAAGEMGHLPGGGKA
jgi:hypothetical protein